MKIKRKYILNTSLLFCLIAITVLSVVVYQAKITQNVRTKTYNLLSDSATAQTATLNAILSGQYRTLESFAQSISIDDISDNKTLTQKMNAVVYASNFSGLGIINNTGTLLMDTGLSFDVNERKYFHTSLSGTRAIEKIQNSYFDNSPKLVLSAPFFKNGEIAGVVVGCYSDDDFKNMVYANVYSGKGYSFICDNKGNIIVRSSNSNYLVGMTNIFDFFDKVKTIGKNPTTIRHDLKTNSANVISYDYIGQKRYTAYRPIGFNNWFIFTVMDGISVEKEIRHTSFIGYLLIAIVCICCFFVLMITSHSDKTKLLEIKNLQEKQLELHRTDDLTKTLSFSGFVEQATVHLQNNALNAYIISFDIALFNYYNSLNGYTEGDELLKKIANYTSAILSDDELISRIYADNFVCLLRGNSQKEIEERITTVINNLKKTNFSYKFFIHYGIYPVTDVSLSVRDMISYANEAKLTIKDRFNTDIAVYDEVLREKNLISASILSSLGSGIKNKEFTTYYQPQYDAKTGELVGAEALVRWLLPSGSLLPPSRFINLFEQTGLIPLLDFYMLENVCKKIGQMLDQNIKVIPIAVNFSKMHLYDNKFINKVTNIINKYNIPPKYIEVELTELSLMDAFEITLPVILKLKELGFIVVIDDFGSGFSSLNLLKNIPVDIIKLDKDFMCFNGEKEKSMAIIRSILSLAKELSLKVIAEGVETKEQLEFLQNNSCDIIQGFYFSRPLTENNFEKLFAE